MNKQRRISKKTFLAYTKESYVPTVGEHLKNFTIIDYGILYDAVKSSRIVSVEIISEKIFKVETSNTIYILETS